MENDFRISPEPPGDHRDAILAAVEQTLRREASLARPSVWRLSGWVGQRVGIIDLGRWLSPERRWSLASTLPRGGRVFNGLTGRGDAR